MSVHLALREFIAGELFLSVALGPVEIECHGSLITVGEFGGTLQTGRILDYTDAGDDHRKLCSLYFSLMEKTGVKLPDLVISNRAWPEFDALAFPGVSP